jgi:hypothetical protein
MREFGGRLEEAADQLAAVPDVQQAVQGLRTFVRAHNSDMSPIEITTVVELAIKKILVLYEKKK